MERGCEPWPYVSLELMLLTMIPNGSQQVKNTLLKYWDYEYMTGVSTKKKKKRLSSRVNFNPWNHRLLFPHLTALYWFQLP